MGKRPREEEEDSSSISSDDSDDSSSSEPAKKKAKHAEGKKHKKDKKKKDKKKKKKKKSKKDKKKKKKSEEDIEDLVLQWERQLLIVVNRIKESPDAPRPPSDKGFLRMRDYFQKHAEYSHWLSKEKGKAVADLSTAKAKKGFFEFAMVWNTADLPSQYYQQRSATQLDPRQRTTYQWGFAKNLDTHLTTTSARDQVKAMTGGEQSGKKIESWKDLAWEPRGKKKEEETGAQDAEGQWVKQAEMGMNTDGSKMDPYQLSYSHSQIKEYRKSQFGT